MTRWMRTLHKWVGLVLAAQFVLWMASGLAISLLDHEEVQGHHHRAAVAAVTPAWPVGTLTPAQMLAAAPHAVRSVETAWLRDRAVYRLAAGESAWLVDARSGERVTVDAATAAAIAAADYVGPGQAGAPALIGAATLEARGHHAPIWRVDFDDEDHTTLYASGQDGRILERRNDLWRWFDIAWMLHIMDYTDRDDFNNPLVVTAAAGGLWIALTGVWLLLASLRIRRTARPVVVT